MINQLIDCINEWQKSITVILEPREAVGRHCGYYVGTVLDIIDNNERLLFVIFRDDICQMYLNTRIVQIFTTLEIAVKKHINT